MAGKRRPSAPRSAASAGRGGLTGERLVRLYRLLRLLGTPQKRETLTRRLRIDVRGFYRDLESLRSLGIQVTLDKARYRLEPSPNDALARLPFPDPQLTCGEALALAKGRTAAHRKLKRQIESLTA